MSTWQKVFSVGSALTLLVSTSTSCFAQISNVDKVNAILADIAAKNGTTARVYTSSPSAPAAQTKTVFESHAESQAAVLYSTATHTPDFTPEEAAIFSIDETAIAPPISNPDVHVPTAGIEYDILTGTDVTITGLLQDIATSAPDVSVDAGSDLTETLDQSGSLSAIDSSTGIDEILHLDAHEVPSVEQPLDLFSQTVQFEGDHLSIQSLSNSETLQNVQAGSPTFIANSGVIQLPGLVWNSADAPSCSPIAVELSGGTEGEKSKSSSSVKLVAITDLLACAIVDENHHGALMLQGKVETSEHYKAQSERRVEIFQDQSGNSKRTADGDIVLDSGDNFVVAKERTQIETPAGFLTLEKNGFASVEIQGDTVKIRACSGPGLVHFSADGQNIELNIGEELAIGKNSQVNVAADLDDQIAKRNVVKHELRSGRTAYISEFSIVTLMSGDRGWQQVRVSNSTAADEFEQKILKSMAAVSLVRKHHGRYYGGGDAKIPAKAFQAI